MSAPNTPDPTHFQPLHIDGKTYTYDSTFAHGVNKPKLFVSESGDSSVVVKHFQNSTFARVAMGAFQTWQQVRETLVRAGFPDILDVDSTRQISEYVQGVPLSLIPDRDITSTIDLVRVFLSSITHHLDLLSQLDLQHGDVKIDNMVARQSPLTPHPASTMLIDFDFLHLIDRCTDDHIGTPMCTPPEFFRSNISHRTRDIYSLGFSSIYALMGDCDRFKFHEQPWANGYFHGSYYMIRSYRERHGMPSDIIRDGVNHMRKILLPSAPQREQELEQILDFISASIQNDPYARPQNGREVREMIGL